MVACLSLAHSRGSPLVEPGGFAISCAVQLPYERMKRLFVLSLLPAATACASPPPPSVAGAPPPPPSSYLVFFDWSSAALGPGASEVIQLAANAYRAGAPGTVQVTGYTDTSGSYRYNERLSVRRARAVAATLA